LARLYYKPTYKTKKKMKWHIFQFCTAAAAVIFLTFGLLVRVGPLKWLSLSSNAEQVILGWILLGIGIACYLVYLGASFGGASIWRGIFSDKFRHQTLTAAIEILKRKGCVMHVTVKGWEWKKSGKHSHRDVKFSKVVCLHSILGVEDTSFQNLPNLNELARSTVLLKINKHHVIASKATWAWCRSLEKILQDHYKHCAHHIDVDVALVLEDVFWESSFLFSGTDRRLSVLFDPCFYRFVTFFFGWVDTSIVVGSTNHLCHSRCGKGSRFDSY
jgi:hypothetical protein